MKFFFFQRTKFYIYNFITRNLKKKKKISFLFFATWLHKLLFFGSGSNKKSVGKKYFSTGKKTNKIYSNYKLWGGKKTYVTSYSHWQMDPTVKMKCWLLHDGKQSTHTHTHTHTLQFFHQYLFLSLAALLSNCEAPACRASARSSSSDSFWSLSRTLSTFTRMMSTTWGTSTPVTGGPGITLTQTSTAPAQKHFSSQW